MTDDKSYKADPDGIDVRTANDKPQATIATYTIEPMSVDELIWLRMNKHSTQVRVDLK